jgi:cell division protease FtsH
MNPLIKTILFWVLLLMTTVLLYNVFSSKPSGKITLLNFSKFLEEVDNKNVRRATIVDSEVTGVLVSGESFKTVIPADYPALYDKLKGVDVLIEHAVPNPWMSALTSWAPFLMIIGFWVFFMRQIQRSGGHPFKLRQPGSDGTNMVQLEPDVAKAFSNSQAVNEALRLVIQLTEIRGTT